MPFVTILTPLFNGIEYFEECYNGIINQTESDWVWLIGINGHNDNTIFSKLKEKISDKRIFVKQFETIGKVNTLNEMMKDVTTEYIALCDVDDIWFPTKLELQKMFVNQFKEIDVFATNLQYIGEMNHVPELPHGIITFDILSKINPVVNSSVIMKKTVAFWEDRFGLEDYDLWFRCLLSSKKIFTIPHPFIYHRVYKNSYFNNSGRQDLNGLLKYYLYDVTVVTAYYPMKSKFEISDYMKWLEFWKSQPCNLVFFTSQEFVPLIENLRQNYKEKTNVIALDFNNLEAFQKYGKNFWMKEKEKDFESYHNYELYAIWYEKKEFVKKAITLNPFSTTKFVWCDAGICRQDGWREHIRKFPLSYIIPDNKFLVLRITDFEQFDDFLKINCVGGGILAARKELWLEFSDKYDKMLNRYIFLNKFVGKDQSIIASMVKETPEFFQLIKRPENFDDFTCWFTLLFYLSAAIPQQF
jgi:glycosyltransferase involved in cell wall biosynthesis